LASVPASPAFDSIVAEAARSARTPVAFLAFLTESGETVQASRGWNFTSVPMTHSFSARVAGEQDLLIVSDTTRDARLAGHPQVVGAPNIRFFAAVPLIDEGRFIGALIVLGRAPRSIEPDQAASLRFLARQILREIENRRDRDALSDRFREFFEHTDDLIMSIAPDGRLLHANEAVANSLGFPRDEVMREPLIRFIEPSARDEFRNVLKEVFEIGEPRVAETVFLTAAGRRMTVEGSLRPRVIDGNAVLARVIFRDITQRKEYEIEMGNARDAAMASARVKTQFLTNVSHEIRTPMNGIVGMIDLMLSTPLNIEQRDYAVQARASADQLLAIVNNILYVSNVEAAGLGSTNVDFDLYRTLDRVVEVMKVAALGKEIDVSLIWDKKLPPILRGNQAKLRQIINNLMENAVKFTDRGFVALRVSQQTETESHRVIRFEVSDSGIGIAAEDRLLLFEKFSQLESNSTRRYQGTGLGLATARHLVETLGGLIDVDTAPGKGSNFWFAVPFPKQTHAGRPIASSDLELKGKRVLLVDELPTSRKILRHYLDNGWEMRVQDAVDAGSALMELMKNAAVDPFRVVVFDRMSDMDPLDFAKAIRADSRLSKTSLVFAARTAAEVNRELLRAAGINAVVIKPVGQSELFDAMTVALAHDAIPLARAVSQPAAAERPVPPYVSPEKRRTVRVLLAEDNNLNAKLTMSQLQKLGYEADSVPNGKEAIDAVRSKEYNIVLMDCQMPLIDGYEATMEIRRHDTERGHKRRIIAMTANALEGDREKCLAAGMDDYLSKPTKHEELEMALARYFV
jgi:two-component system, sensor histidine kinase and response regulator